MFLRRRPADRGAARRSSPATRRAGQRSALLPLLHLVQSEEGYVSPAGVAFCAEVLGLNKAQVGAVATFYTMYKRRPTGDYLVSVCTNTMCNVLGGQEVYDTLVRAPGRRARRDDRRRHDHAGARRVPGGLRLRPGDDGQLRLLRRRRPRDARSAWSTSCARASGRCRPAAPGSARSRRWRCSSPASPTSATARSPTAGRASPRCAACAWPSSTASRCRASTRTPRSAARPRPTGRRRGEGEAEAAKPAAAAGSAAPVKARTNEASARPDAATAADHR